MTQIETRLEKSKHYGWKAKSEIKLGEREFDGKKGEVTLDVVTYRMDQRGIITSISGGINIGRDGYATRTTAIFQDYYKRVVHNAPRATEKSVGECHAKALAVIDDHVTAAKAQYGFN